MTSRNEHTPLADRRIRRTSNAAIATAAALFTLSLVLGYEGNSTNQENPHPLTTHDARAAEPADTTARFQSGTRLNNAELCHLPAQKRAVFEHKQRPGKTDAPDNKPQ